MFDLAQFDKYREDNRREVKKAKHGLPVSLWDTYSSYANVSGGVIILGVKELEDRTWYTTGLKDPAKLQKDFWDTINNRTKVSINLLKEKDLEVHEKDGDTIIVIHVPAAGREQKPVYINNDLFGGSFRRDWEGDYHCTEEEVRAMLRDSAGKTTDMKILDRFALSDLNQDTVRAYRNYHRSSSEGHPFANYADDRYLRSIGAAGVSENDGKLHPTAAGLLMFGNEYDIVQEFPDYFLDFQEHLDPSIRWTDRLESSSGTWSGNVFDFFFRAYNKIAIDLKVPFGMEGVRRVDDTPVHKAVREALVNCLTNADFFLPRGVVIRKMPKELILENPGSIRIGKQQMLLGGVSDCRNKALMKMFNLLDFGERSGSGVPNILQIWEAQGWKKPVVEEVYGPDRTTLTLEFIGAEEEGVGQDVGRNVGQDVGRDNIPAIIIDFIKRNNKVTKKAIAGELGVSEKTIERLMKTMDNVQYVGRGSNGHWEILDK